MASAFEQSAVWVYQEIARAAGQAIMSKALASFEYGNEDVETADRLTTYWLDNALTISAMEQSYF